MKKRYAAALVLASVMTLPQAMAKTLNVVSSFSVLGDIVSQVGGEHVKVTTLVGPNGDPHSFEPRPQDSQALASADVVFVSGLGLEGWMDRLINASGYKGKVVVSSQGVNARTMSEEGKLVTDPHAWNSMRNGEIYANNVMNALIAADPEDASDIAKRGKAYIAQLARLDKWAESRFAAVPASRRKVLTSHDAFGYFGARYGVTFLSPVGFSTDSEASAADVAALITQLKKEGTHLYFIENQTDPRLVQQIAAATGAKPGGELYPEALSNADGDAATYTAAFTHNVNALLKSME